jgi:hypothetical protein
VTKSPPGMSPIAHHGEVGALPRPHLNTTTWAEVVMRQGQVPWNLGVPCTEETREKLRQANTGRKHSEEARRKMREAWKRRKEKMNGLA